MTRSQRTWCQTVDDLHAADLFADKGANSPHTACDPAGQNGAVSGYTVRWSHRWNAGMAVHSGGMRTVDDYGLQACT